MSVLAVGSGCEKPATECQRAYRKYALFKPKPCTRGCSDGDAESCSIVAWSKVRGDTPLDPTGALEYARKACKLSPKECSSNWKFECVVEPGPCASRCSGGDVEACSWLAQRTDGGRKVAAGVEGLRGDISYYEFGRDGSPVIYVHLPAWTNQRERSCPAQRCAEGAWGPSTPDARELTAAERDELVARARKLFQGLGAEEIRPGASDLELRAWWD